MANKSLGQHWLNDRKALDAIIEAAEIQPTDTVLEIGPGLGSLTRRLVKRAAKVIAVEIDHQLAERLRREIPADNLEIVEKNILKFDFRDLPPKFKLVANIPYYLTGNLLRLMTELIYQPELMVLLVQKEVAERIVAKPGQLSVLAISLQLYYDASLGRLVPAELFSPPPKVDSQLIVLRRRAEPALADLDEKAFFQLVKAGFSEKRKKLRSSLSGGLGLEKQQVDQLLTQAGIKLDARAQELSLEQWHHLYLEWSKQIGERD